MRLVLKTLLFLLALPVFANAQFSVIAEGKTFEEPTTGDVKLVQLKNGNTFYIYLNTKRNYRFFFELYNKAHIKTHESEFSLKDPNMDFGIQTVGEMNGDLMLILSYYEKYSLNLFRVLVDGSTGLVKESKAITDAGVPTPPSFAEEAFAGSPPKRVYVINNGPNEGYSIVILHNASEKNNIEILQFDQYHKELKKSIFPAPDQSFKYMYLAGATSIDKNNMGLLCYSYNTRSSGGKSHLLITYMVNMENNITSTFPMPATGDDIVANGILRFNSVSKQLLCLFATEKKKNSLDYHAYLTSIAIPDKKILYTKEISPVTALEKSKDLFNRKKSKINSPLNLFVNKNGSFAVVYEDIDYEVANSAYVTQYTTNLGNIAVQQFDTDGNEKACYLIAKSQNLNQSKIALHYQQRSENNFVELDNGKQYKYRNIIQKIQGIDASLPMIY